LAHVLNKYRKLTLIPLIHNPVAPNPRGLFLFVLLQNAAFFNNLLPYVFPFRQAIKLKQSEDTEVFELLLSFFFNLALFNQIN
jgi:hypothetical protein